MLTTYIIGVIVVFVILVLFASHLVSTKQAKVTQLSFTHAFFVSLVWPISVPTAIIFIIGSVLFSK